MQNIGTFIRPPALSFDNKPRTRIICGFQFSSRIRGEERTNASEEEGMRDEQIDQQHYAEAENEQRNLFNSELVLAGWVCRSHDGPSFSGKGRLENGSLVAGPVVTHV
jgi:hypothetical protein